MSSTALAVALAVVAGLAGAVQAAVMGELGERVGILPALAFSGIVTVAIAVLALLSAERSLDGVRAVLGEPVWLWTGGVLSLFIILAVTVGPPRIGTAATIAIVIVGNLVMAALVDQFGWFGLERIPLTWPRLLGLGLLVAGAALTLRRS